MSTPDRNGPDTFTDPATGRAIYPPTCPFSKPKSERVPLAVLVTIGDLAAYHYKPHDPFRAGFCTL